MSKLYNQCHHVQRELPRFNYPVSKTTVVLSSREESGHERPAAQLDWLEMITNAMMNDLELTPTRLVGASFISMAFQPGKIIMFLSQKC